MKKVLEMVQKGYLYALLCLVAGLMLVIWPGQTVWGVYYTAALALMALGAVRIIRYFRTEAIEAHRRLTFASGAMLAVAGILLFIYRQRLGAWLPELAGAALLGVCCIRAQVSVDMRRRAFSRWWLPLSAAGVYLVLATLCLAGAFELNPKLILCGAALLLEAIVHTLCALWFSRTDHPARPGQRAVQPANYTYTWTAEGEKSGESEEPQEK